MNDYYFSNIFGIFQAKPLSCLPDKTMQKIDNYMEFPGHKLFETLKQDQSLGRYVEQYLQFRENVRQESMGKTGQFWLSYMDHVWLVLQFQQAVKQNDFLFYAHCLNSMTDLFFFNGQHYARYLTFFAVFIANIATSHPGATELFKKGAISVARFMSGNHCAVDKILEETFIKHSKSHGGAGGNSAGLSGILTNHDSYQRWVRTAH